MKKRKGLAVMLFRELVIVAVCALSGSMWAQSPERNHYKDREAIAEAFALGQRELAIQRAETVVAARNSAKEPALRRLDLLRDVAVILHAGAKTGLAEVAVELRKIPMELRDKEAVAEAWSQVGEIEERLLDDFTSAKISYGHALTNASGNPRAKRGLERIAAREQLSLRFQQEQEAMRAGRFN